MTRRASKTLQTELQAEQAKNKKLEEKLSSLVAMMEASAAGTEASVGVARAMLCVSHNKD